MYRRTTPIVLLFATLVTAQPVIQNGNNLPGPGFNVERRVGNSSLTEGPAGANQTWDFSSDVLVYTAEQYVVLEPATSTYASTWPSANYVATYADAGDVRYFYYNVLADRLEAVAENVNNPSDGDIFSANPRTKLKFPFAFGETVSDTYTDPFGNYGVNVTYDGYGTLITSTNVFDQVVRVKWQQTWQGGAGNSFYEWWTLDPLVSVFQYYSGVLVQYAAIGAGIHEQTGTTSVSVQPNPFTDVTTITVDAASVANKATLTLTNTMGQVVRTTSLLTTTTQLDRGTLANGIYVYKVTTADNAVTTGRIVLN